MTLVCLSTGEGTRYHGPRGYTPHQTWPRQGVPPDMALDKGVPPPDMGGTETPTRHGTGQGGTPNQHDSWYMDLELGSTPTSMTPGGWIWN